MMSVVDLQEKAQVAAGSPGGQAWTARVPAEVEAVFRNFRTAEVATLAKDGTPIAWPMTVIYRPESGHFVTTTSIAIPQKAFNARRDGRMSLLYSDPTASGLVKPPAVLVQGDATVSEPTVWNDELRELWKTLAIWQPASNVYAASPLMRRFMDWYYMRLLLRVVPTRILWWPDGDFSRAPRAIEVEHVD